MAAAGRAVAVAAMVAAALPLLACGGYADCYDYCFKDCISKDKSMRDYCSYACDKTCAPDAAAPRRPVAQLPMNCQLACVRESCHRRRADGNGMKACYGQCYDRGCETDAGLPRPLRAGGGAGIVPPAESRDHPFHKKRDAVGAAALPDHPFDEKQDALGPAAALPGQPFHKMHGAVKPAGEPDPGYVVYPGWGPVRP